MPDSKFFGIPFATSGDKAAIPEDVQPSGAISYTQGFGPDYERDPETDPLAKRVPRDETNELYYQLTNSVRFLQLYGVPEWYALDDGGDPVSYPLTARVRHPLGGVMTVWVSLVAANTAEPGTDATKWAADTAFNIADLEATLAEALASTVGNKLITPRRLGPAVQRGAWNYAVAGGTANAITAALSPAPAALSAGMPVYIKAIAANTGAVTLNVNGLGAVAVKKFNGAALVAGDIASGDVLELVYDGTAFQLFTPSNNLIVAGASTAKAPKLVTLEVNKTANTLIPTSTDSVLPFESVVTNSLGTSTWNGASLTIGAGEGGFWNIRGSWLFFTPTNGIFAVGRVKKNGTTTVLESVPGYHQAGGGSIITAGGIVKLSPGDYVEFAANQQSGADQTAFADTGGNQRTQFVAQLVSAF